MGAMAATIASFHDEIDRRADEIEQARALPADLVERLAKEGAFRSFAPVPWAGLMSGEALSAEHPFERRIRDAHTLRHHAALYDRVYELTGRIMLGIDDDSPLV